MMQKKPKIRRLFQKVYIAIARKIGPMKQRAILFAAILAVPFAVAQLNPEGQKYAAYMTIAAILISLPAFISLYVHTRKTNLGRLLLQPFIAMFIGFFGIMLNSVLDIWRVFQGYEVDNAMLLMGINRTISSILIAVGCVLLFMNLKRHGLLSMAYYQKADQKKEK